MKKLFFILLQIVIGTAALFAQTTTLQERLGYSKETKLLIIHADDLGVAHSENAASTTAMEKGVVNSASIMVPCPWFPEIAAYARRRPAADFGLHLTLTSEWKHLKWGPVSLRDKVPGLINKNGFFYESVDSLYKTATVAEVEMELRAQIERAKQFGIDPTHLDSHMGALFGRSDFLKVLINLGREYKIPVMLGKFFFQALGVNVDSVVNNRDVLLDMIYIASPEDYKKGMKEYYTRVLKSVQPGVNCLILHAAYDNDEMRAVTIDHPDYGSAWRQADFDFFTSEECRQLLKDQSIKLITWREIRDKLLR